MSKIELGAYFYPLTTQCQVKRARAEAVGRAMGILDGLPVVDETVLAQQAVPLFPGHKQPVRHCLGVGAEKWDDADEEAMDIQIGLAQDAGLDFFIFDSYEGTKKGSPIIETGEVIDTFRGLALGGTMKYAKMQTFASPRVVLPVSKDPEYCEPDRLYDLDTNSVRFIVDRCIEKDWFLPNYLTVEGRPYISLFVPDMTPGWQGSVERLQRIVDELHQYSRDMYKVEPYVVGSIRTVEQAKELTQAGVDALTGYAFLPVFGDNAAPIQYYNQLLEERKPDWRAICDINTFIPPAVVGWDASPRGKSMHQLGATTGHAYAPVVVDSTAEAFEQMLRDSLVFTSSAVPESERYGIICAWNEITEGASLLPQIGEDGTLDTAYLDVVRRVTSGEDYEPATT